MSEVKHSHADDFDALHKLLKNAAPQIAPTTGMFQCKFCGFDAAASFDIAHGADCIYARARLALTRLPDFNSHARLVECLGRALDYVDDYVSGWDEANSEAKEAHAFIMDARALIKEHSHDEG